MEKNKHFPYQIAKQNPLSRIAIIEEIDSAPTILALNWWLPD